jgi:DegV family protein with EDD domain
MSTVHIITDSACDIPDDVVGKLNITVVPLSIRFGDEEFVDCRDLTPAQFWAKCHSSSTLPETAAPAPGAFRQAYDAAADGGATGVVVIALSGDLSATCQSATLGADGFDRIPVTVVDSRAVTLAQGLTVIAAATLAATGASLDEVVALARDYVSKAHVIGTIDTLDHLIKGGRLTGAKALLGSMLSVKPLLKLENGVVVEAGRARTRSKAFAQLHDAAAAAGPLAWVGVTHGDAPDVDKLLDLLDDLTIENPIVVSQMGSVVGTHGGPGIVGLSWITA